MKVFVSRKGLVQCPACQVHFRPDGDAWDASWLASTTCPHCDTPVGTRTNAGTLDRLRRAGRSGLMAAALFGMAAAGPLACSSPQQKDDKPAEEDPDAGTKKDDADAKPVEPVPAPDPPDEPEYGVPPEPPDTPLYGMAPGGE